MRRPSVTVADIFASPELAALSVLETAAEIARLALVAAYPDVSDSESPPERKAACSVIDAAADLVIALHRYRLALARARDHDREDVSPF